MREFYLFCILTWCSVFCFAQEQQRFSSQRDQRQQEEKEKMSYLTVSGDLGSSSFNYKLHGLNEKGSRKGQLGYGFEVKYSYFFNPHWGVSTGVGFSRYATKGKLKGSLAEGDFYNLGPLIDDDLEERPINFQLRTRVTNLEEKQTAWLINVPIMANYQTYFGDSSRWGLYGGLGIKLQFPVNTKFRIRNGHDSQLNVSGFYEGIPTDMGSPQNPPVPQHGYGTINDPNASLGWDDKSKLKMGIAGTAEFGFMIDLGKDMDLMLGGYLDYGFTDIKKKSGQQLFTAPTVYHPAADNRIGNGISYNGMMNSTATGKIRPISYGAKIALRFNIWKSNTQK